MNKVWHLEHHRLLRDVPRSEIKQIAHIFRERDYKRKELIFGAGDVSDSIYLLKTGHVRLYRVTEDGKEVTLAILRAGDVFGELALFDETHRTTFAEALDDAHICATSVEQFTKLMAHRPEIAVTIAKEIARRRCETEAQIVEMAYATVGGRVTAALMHLAEQHGETLENGDVRITLRLSHQELANMIGSSRESCTMELQRLQKRGIIAVDDEHRFVLTSRRPLEAPARVRSSEIPALR